MCNHIEKPSYDPAVKMTPIRFIKQAVAEIKFDFCKNH